MLTIEELVNKNFDKLNDTDLFIWKYIVNHKRECSSYTIYELAGKCNVSRTTILRFAKKLSLSGYSELKAILNFEQKSGMDEMLFDISTTFDTYHRVIDDLSKKDFHRINELIYGAKHLYTYATGIMQNNIMNELRRMFNNSGDYIINIGNAGEIGYFLNHIEKNDLVFIISLSGENKDTIDFARKLRLRDVNVLSITKLSDNTLASICNENIYIHSPNFYIATDGRPDFNSSVGFFVAIEALYLNYQMYKKHRLDSAK